MAQLNFATMPTKSAAEKKPYGFKWTPELEKDGDSIATGAPSSLWAIEAGVTINTTDRVNTHDDQTTTVWLDPGSTPGEYTLKNTITTTNGLIHVATATLKVVA